MTSYLAPERSGPSSVISEYYFQQLNFSNELPMINNEKKNVYLVKNMNKNFVFI